MGEGVTNPAGAGVLRRGLGGRKLEPSQGLHPALLSGGRRLFRSLAQGRIVSLKIKLEELHPEDRAFISDPGLLALGTNQLNTAGDVYALTAGALSVMLTNLKTFRQSPSATNYAIVRDDMSLLLRIGQVTSVLLESAH